MNWSYFKYRFFLFGEVLVYLVHGLLVGMLCYLGVVGAVVAPHKGKPPGSFVSALGLLLALPVAWPVSALFGIHWLWSLMGVIACGGIIWQRYSVTDPAGCGTAGKFISAL